MPHFGPIKRRELIACLRRLGFSGPYTGGKHEFMQRGGLSLTQTLRLTLPCGSKRLIAFTRCADKMFP